MRRLLQGVCLLLAIKLAAISITAEPSLDGIITLVQQGHFKKARTSLTAYLQKNPNDSRAHAQMSKILVAFMSFDDGIRQAEKALESDRNNSEYHTELAQAIGAKLNSNGVGLLEKASLAERFKKEAQIALQLDPKNSQAAAALAEFYMLAPGIMGGDKSKAKAIVDQFIATDPAHGYLMSARLAVFQKEPSGAVEPLFRRAADAGPNQYEMQIALANFYLSEKNLTSAESYATRASKIDPQQASGWTILAIVYTQQGKWSQLDSVLAEAEHEVPEDLAPFFQAGRVTLLSGPPDQLTRAEKYFRKYLLQEPEPRQPPWSRAHWRLGQVLAKKGQTEEAKKEFERALALEQTLKEAADDLKRLQ